MKKTLGLILLILLLGGAAWYLTQNKQKDNMPVSTSLYAIDDINRVYTAGLVYPDGKKVKLERTPKGWLFNGQKANESVIMTLLNTIRKQRILYATPASLKPTMLESLAIKKIKVELYDKDKQLLQKFYVGAPANDGNSTFFIKEGSNEPHLVGITGFVGTIGSIYNRPMSDWINKTIFKLEPKDITTVSLEYPNMKNRSFHLTHDGQNYTVKPFYAITPQINKDLKLGAGETFLGFFHKIGAEAYEPNIELRDSLTNLVPFLTLTLSEKDNKKHIAKFYPFVPMGTSMDELTGKDRDSSSPLGVNRYYVITEDNKCYLTQHRVIGKILWRYQNFFD